MSQDEDRRLVVWHCDPPPRGVPFRVTREGWTFENGREVRQIHTIEVYDARLPDDE